MVVEEAKVGVRAEVGWKAMVATAGVVRKVEVWMVEDGKEVGMKVVHEAVVDKVEGLMAVAAVVVAKMVVDWMVAVEGEAMAEATREAKMAMEEVANAAAVMEAEGMLAGEA